MKKAVLKNFAIFTRKLQVCNFIKNRLQHRSVPYKVRLSPSKKSCVICLIEIPLKDDEKCFLFRLKSFFRSQDISGFGRTFCHIEI